MANSFSLSSSVFLYRAIMSKRRLFRFTMNSLNSLTFSWPKHLSSQEQSNRSLWMNALTHHQKWDNWKKKKLLMNRNIKLKQAKLNAILLLLRRRQHTKMTTQECQWSETHKHTHTMELLSDHFTKRNNIEWSFWPFFEATSRMNDLVSLVFKRLTIGLQTKRFLNGFVLIEDIFSGNFEPFSYILWRTVFYTWFWLFTYFSTFFWFQSAPGVSRQTHFVSGFFLKFERLAILLRNLKSNQIFFQIEKYFSFKSKFKNSCKSEPDQEKINFSVQEESMMKKYPNRSIWFQFLKMTFSEVLRAYSSEIPRFMEWGSELRGPKF